MEHLKNLLEGARHVLVFDTGSEYIRPSRNGFLRDVKALRQDSAQITSSLNKETRKYVKAHPSKY